MKKILFVIIIILFFFEKGNAQTKMPKNVNDDFGYSIIYSYKNRYDNTQVFIMQKLREKGYDPMDVGALVESIVDNTKNRNIILEVFHDYFGKNKEYLYANLVSLGISATNSKYLTDYIIEEKYKSPNVKDDKVNNVLNNVSNIKNSNFFTGKKKFCEGLKSWYYLVTIEKDNITFESYPDTENGYHKDKTKPVEVVKGKIIGDIIKIPRPKNCEDCGEGYETGRFKYKNGFLYNANYEGGYNVYTECGNTRNIDEYKEVNYIPDPNKISSIDDNKHYKTELSLEIIKRELTKKYNYIIYDTSLGFYTISENNNICTNISVEKTEKFNILHYYFDCF